MPFDPIPTQSKSITVSARENTALRGLLYALCVVCTVFVYSLVAAVGASAAEETQTATPITSSLPVSVEATSTPPTLETPTIIVVVPTATYALPHIQTSTQVPVYAPPYTPTYLPADTPTYLPADTPTEVAIAIPNDTATGVVAATASGTETEIVAAPTVTAEIAIATVAERAAATSTRTNTATAGVTATATSTSTPTLTSTTTPTWLPPGPECVPKPGPTVVKLDVPYMHQVMDFGSADGNWACGPTSIAMVLAYYGKLQPWNDYVAEQAASVPTTPLTNATSAPSVTPLQASKPNPSANFSPYVTTPYTNNGHTYSATARDPLGNRVAGLYGAICPTGFADWSLMADVLQWHGLSSRQIGPSWDAIVAALKRGHPVLIGNGLTSEGHILVAIGYTTNGQLLVNDPYGNRFAPGYGGTSGKGLFYPWTCMRARNALEVIGTYPPPPRPTHTPLPTATATITGTVTATTTVVAAYTAQVATQAATRQAPTDTRTATPPAPSTSLSATTGESQSKGRSTADGPVAPKLGAVPPLPGRQSDTAKDLAIGGSVLSAVVVLTALFGLRGRRKARTENKGDTTPQDGTTTAEGEANQP